MTSARPKLEPNLPSFLPDRFFTALRRPLLGLALAAATAPVSAASADPGAFHPPWSHGAGDPASQHGLEFTVPEVDNLPDFHGDPFTARLALFVGGNYFFAMPPLVRAFEQRHPEFQDSIYYETIPPGLLVEQIRKGGTVTVGNMTWTVHADVYAAGLNKVKELVVDGTVVAPAVPYATNTLTIMVPRGNPAAIGSLADLARPGVRLVMPNPAFEGVARQIKASLAKAGGEELVKAVYETKVARGETVLTRIHHRQSPLFLMLGRADAGITWQSEAIFQEQVGNPITHVVIPDDQNATGIYAAAALKDAPHPEAARLWVDFLTTPEAASVLAQFGFKPYRKEE